MKSIRKPKPPSKKAPPRYSSRLLYALFLILFVSLVGTIGYYLIEEQWSMLDAFYMTIITLTTVGFGETHDLTDKGRVFTIVLIISSMGIAGYSVSTIASFVLEGQLNDIIRGRRMENYISGLSQHIIVCGGGRTGKHVVAELYKMRTPFVVIEQREEVLDALRTHVGDILYIQADATEDDTLLEAGIRRARGLIAALGDDKDNVFIVLSARSLNPNLQVIARCNEEVNAEKLRKAGANEVVSPNAIGGMRMASMMLRPNVVGFLDEMMHVTGQTLRFEEVFIEDGHSLANQTLEQAHIGRKTGLLVVAIRSPDGSIRYNPGGKTLLSHGDVLIILGTRAQVAELYNLLNQSSLDTSLADVLYNIEEH